MNAYELLECSETDDLDIIKANYRRLILKYHPDKLDPTSSENSSERLDLFIRINAAFKLLNNAQLRKEYNALLRQVSLKKKTDAYVDEYATMFSLTNDFSFDSNTNLYKHKCERCSGYFVLNRNDLNNLFNEINPENINNLQEFILTLECDSCSLKIDILLI